MTWTNRKRSGAISIALIAVMMALLVPAGAAHAASKSHSLSNNTGITQTQYLYYNTSTCRGSSSAQMYKTTIKWTRLDSTWAADHQGGTWGYVAIRCDNGVNEVYSRSLADVGGISYGTTYSYSYTFPYVTKSGDLHELGANQSAKVYRGATYKTTICTQTYVWGSGCN